ncbi:hypothetical protein Trco_007374 [Trichoderma cornu-damae]|uniref:Uncharacterized protein n=1 Tax=Trichoderma cornu-damae TaxID=654480 RepID=A0A9P8QJN0_9HYPO|nr:hypothetical protein Trco_007374 [Trichoderma cornu-damae]
MQPVNFNHSSCPKCSATISSESKTCQSCGATPMEVIQNGISCTYKQISQIDWPSSSRLARSMTSRKQPSPRLIKTFHVLQTCSQPQGLR